ncbi:MAG: LysM peptidoglycan-binding domain-containing protein, partial [Gemmatimonadetes bacterium]|nr:LysM peptidoglycan-binding domain-containing protein [Gemmatimonadota bacterium]
MPNPVGGAGSQPGNTPDTNKTVVRHGQTLKQIADQNGVTEADLHKANPHLEKTGIKGGMELRLPDSGNSNPATEKSPGSTGQGDEVSLRPGDNRSRMSRLMSKDQPLQVPGQDGVSTSQTNASAGGQPGSIDRDYVSDLAEKSPEDLQGWYDSASNQTKRGVQRAFSKIDALTLGAEDKAKFRKLGGNLNRMQLEHNQKWATEHYGKMSEREIAHEMQRKTPNQIVEDLGYLSTGSIKGGERVRQKYVGALEKGMRTRQSGTSPSVSYPMISPGHIYEAAAKYNGPGADLVKAESAKMLHDNAQAAAERKYPDPPAKLKTGPKMAKDLYKARMKEVTSDRKKFVRSELAKGASTLKSLMDSNPAGFVKQMENMKGGAKVFPEILTAVARSEYDKDPKKGAEFLGNVIGSTAADFGKSVAGTDWKNAKSVGNDLGFVLGAAEVAIGNVAKEEHAKIDFGKDVLGFATNMIKKSRIPGASQIAEISDKVINELAKNEKGEVTGWKDQIFYGFKALVLETYDKVSP